MLLHIFISQILAVLMDFYELFLRVDMVVMDSCFRFWLRRKKRFHFIFNTLVGVFFRFLTFSKLFAKLLKFVLPVLTNNEKYSFLYKIWKFWFIILNPTFFITIREFKIIACHDLFLYDMVDWLLNMVYFLFYNISKILTDFSMNLSMIHFYYFTIFV